MKTNKILTKKTKEKKQKLKNKDQIKNKIFNKSLLKTNKFFIKKLRMKIILQKNKIIFHWYKKEIYYHCSYIYLREKIHILIILIIYY